jgi:cob(I)alamin adenosyltransferase
MRVIKTGHIYLYYGTGGGKTTNALGLALRSVGHRHKVVVIQFMKWYQETGEYKIKDMISDYYEIRQFGRPGWLKLGEENSKIKSEFLTRQPSEEDQEAAQKGLEFAQQKLKEGQTDLLILDELCLAVKSDLLTLSSVLSLLDNIPAKTTVVLTGRYASKELIDKADFVNEIVEIKSPKKFVTDKGIQY